MAVQAELKILGYTRNSVSVSVRVFDPTNSVREIYEGSGSNTVEVSGRGGGNGFIYPVETWGATTPVKLPMWFSTGLLPVQGSFNRGNYQVEATVSYRTEQGGSSQTVTTPSVSFTGTNQRLPFSAPQARRIASRTANVRAIAAQNRNNTAYFRVRRLDSFGVPITVRVDYITRSTSPLYTPDATVGGLFPGQPYVLDVSGSLSFTLGQYYSIVFETLPLQIDGLVNPTLSVDNTTEFWRRMLGLRRMGMNLDGQPAGYSPTGTVDRDIKRAEIMRALAARFFAGWFEDRWGGWDLWARSLWKQRPITARFTKDKFSIIDRTSNNRIREDLRIRLFRYRRHEKSEKKRVDGEIVTVYEDSLQQIEPTLDDIVSKRRTYDISGSLFVLVDDVPGTVEPMLALGDEDAPEVVVFDVSAILKDGTESQDLWSCQPGARATVELGGFTKTGIVMKVRYSYKENQLPVHRVVMIVHESRKL